MAEEPRPGAHTARNYGPADQAAVGEKGASQAATGQGGSGQGAAGHGAAAQAAAGHGSLSQTGHGHIGQGAGGSGTAHHGVTEPSAGHQAAGPKMTANQASERGIRATKISLALLMVTALAQGVVAVVSGSAALFADTLHNFGDAFTAIPLWIAFRISQRPPNRQYTHGYHRSEDLAGLIILLFIFISAVVAGWESIQKLIQGEAPRHIVWAMGAALLGLLGNEVVAQYRIKVGKEIGSAALVADGQHARADGLTSLGAFVGLLGAFFGLTWADPIAGLAITGAILYILWEVGRDLLKRMMDAIDPEVIHEIEHLTLSVPGVQAVHDIRARWLGHRVVGELHLGLPGELTLYQAHEVAEVVRHKLLHEVPNLADVIVHTHSGEGPDADRDTTAHHFQDDQPPAETFRATHAHGPGSHHGH